MDVLENKMLHSKQNINLELFSVFSLCLYTLTPEKFTGLATSGSADTGTGSLRLVIHVVVLRVVRLAPKRVKFVKIFKKKKIIIISLDIFHVNNCIKKKYYEQI